MILGSAAGCSSVQRVTVFQDSLSLPDKRFVGPVHIDVPRRSAHNQHDLEVRVALTARCAPRLVVRFPDGETLNIGARDARWQQLLTARAEAVPAGPREDAPEIGPETGPDRPISAAPGEVTVSGGVGVDAPVETGQWVERDVASWPGQLQFEQMRQQRCAQVTTHTQTYVAGYDELGKVSLWAEVPQEMVDARVDVTVVELVRKGSPDDDSNGAMAKRGQAAPLPAAPSSTVSRRTKKRRRKPRQTSEPTTPEPAPRLENPPRAKAEGATWSPGYWKWLSRGRGKWVWVSGYWQKPGTTPGLKVEDHGPPPVVGCTWTRGHWVWVRGDGSWQWIQGYWNAPPLKVETDRGQPAGPGASWQAGRWQKRGETFVWIAGRWGRPANKREVKPPRPSSGATWTPGFWQPVGDTYKWVAGRWIGGSGGRLAPPPRKRENRPPPPVEGAVWLAGYWRYDEARGKYLWISGHYEVPPGKDFVWVPDPPLPSGQVVGGRWMIRVEVSP